MNVKYHMCALGTALLVLAAGCAQQDSQSQSGAALPETESAKSAASSPVSSQEAPPPNLTPDGFPEQLEVTPTLLDQSQMQISNAVISDMDELFIHFQFSTGGDEKNASVELVGIPDELSDYIRKEKLCSLIFYDEDGTTRAMLSPSAQDFSTSMFLSYHPVLEDWAVLHPKSGVCVYQDQYAYLEQYETAKAEGRDYTAPWEAFYPGEVNDWLRSPMETRGYIVPTQQLSNVAVWDLTYSADLKLEAEKTLEWAYLEPHHILTVKTFGDFGQGMVSFRAPDGQWYFIQYGYNGKHGGMYYQLSEEPPALSEDQIYPWQTK